MTATRTTPDRAPTAPATGGRPSGGPRRTLRAVVVGAGFGGLAAARELRRRGVAEVTVLEKGDRVGGVWRDNTYPGAACDVPSSLYSYSFAPKPDWSRRYGEQDEILRYIEEVAAREELLDLVRTRTEVTSATYDEERCRWTVATRTADGTTEELDVDLVVFAVGQLSRPHVPPLPGIASFRGPAFHSAEWDHDLELAGKRVAVVGTGASAIQFVPHLARAAGHVTVFQRSAPYVVPKPDRAYTRLHHHAFRRFPRTQGFGRELTRTLSELLNRTLGEDTVLTKAFVAAFRLHLRHQVADPALRAKLLPDYAVGCKRLLFSNDWYPALTRDDVEVVTHAVVEVTPDGVRASDGTFHPADVIVYGTGFKATEFLTPVEVTGRGTTLAESWADEAHAYLGMTVPQFPNLFVVYGPNTNLGGSSILSMIECQTGYLGQLVDRLLTGELEVAEVREDVAAGFDREVQERLSRSVWASGCSSWYQEADGRITTNWPGTVQEYRERTAVLQPSDFVRTAAPLRVSRSA
ncbi:flavin-containing monooxygenase [Nocardioides caldifontis]|uniref:flavin-containing monooxygenase n=1 Tax=Nocardioides caldifontis TaxID=2588938 RepID=UPI001EF0752A|nr:NAD(P)/FAD-dependent oxidoreductase [Nocardioides caldifontis]